MSSSGPILPPHVTLLGEALRPLLRKVEGQLGRPVRPIGSKKSFFAESKRPLRQLGDSVGRLISETNGVLHEVASAADLPEAKVHRAVGRFEVVLDELLGGYSELCELRPYPAHKRGHELLVAVYRHTLTQVQGWLLDLIEGLADPIAALKKKGQPTSGDVQLELSLTLTSPPEQDELLDWIWEQTEEKERKAERAEAQAAAIEEARLTEEQKLGFLGGLAAVVAGIFLGGLFFGDD